MTTDHTNDGTFTRDEVSQAMDYAREHGDSRIVDDEGVTRLSFHVPHLDDPPHEPGCNCGESSECPTYAPGLPTDAPAADVRALEMLLSKARYCAHEVAPDACALIDEALALLTGKGAPL